LRDEVGELVRGERERLERDGNETPTHRNMCDNTGDLYLYLYLYSYQKKDEKGAIAMRLTFF
jgi:hypothetical protein